MALAWIWAYLRSLKYPSSEETKKSHDKFKLILLGGPAPGKTSLVAQFVEKKFPMFTNATIGAAWTPYIFHVDGKEIMFDIWDTAGNEWYHEMILKCYCRGSHAAIVIYDIQCRDSFEEAKLWVERLRNELKAPSNFVIFLAGNKADLSGNRAVLCSEAEAYALENDLLFMETSAKTAVNVTEMFVIVARKLLHERMLNPDAPKRLLTNESDAKTNQL